MLKKKLFRKNPQPTNTSSENQTSPKYQFTNRRLRKQKKNKTRKGMSIGPRCKGSRSLGLASEAPSHE